MSPDVLGRSRQMEQLTVSEYQRILAVLRRDAALRKKEQERISKLRSSLQSDGGDRCNSVTSQCKCPVCTSHREVKLQSGEWFYRQIQSRFHRPNAALTDNNNTGQDNGAAMDPDSAQIREFIERLVEALVSGQLDDVKVNRLYSHPEYDRMFSCHHSALCESLVRLSFALQMAIANKPVPEEDTPSSVHAALKQRVQRIIQEAMTLPNLKSQNGNSVHKWDDDIKSMTYEDILATAILNKVIERFQQSTLRDTVDGNSNLLSGRAQAMEHTPKFISRVEIGVNGPGSLEDAESSSQDGLRSWSESSHNDPVSMTIEECIEEEVTTYDSAGEEEDRSSDGMVTTAGSELDFYLSGLKLIKQRRVPFPELGVDIVDGGKEEDYDEHSESSHSPQPTDLVSPVDSWEENWLFQRRRLKAGGSSPMPVPMLVPNPSEDFRARIGDRDAEEVSDLSDCSDGALEDIVLAGMTADLQVPQVSVTRADVYSETCQDLPLLTNEETVAYQSTAELHVDASEELIKASSMECLSEFGQQDSEYTEDYESVTQRQMSSLTEQVAPPVPVPRPRSLPVSSQENKTHEPEEMQPAKLARPQEDVQQDEEPLTAPPRPGTIAEREHRKWESAPPLPNNPYSPENINKRLSQQSTVYSSRSSSAASVDFSEFKAEAKVAAPLQVVCTSSDPDHRRYGRDYYINLSKVASGERRSSSRVTSPLLEQKVADFLTLETEAEPSPATHTSTSDEVAQLCGHVENEIAKWQQEINQTEQQWLKKLQHSSSVDMASSNQKQEKDVTSSSQKQKKAFATATQNGSILLTGTKPSAEQEKTEKQSIGQTPKENSQSENMYGRAEKHKMETNRNKLSRKTAESGEWRNAVTPSECSTVSSSDLDFDADMPVMLPSVKELAKHFSGGGTSDSDSSAPKALPTQSHKPETQNKAAEPSKSILIMEKQRRFQPVREIHSLTARSISREFREGLRRNLPTQLDRNLHTAADSTTSEKWNNGLGDSSCSSPELHVNGVARTDSSENVVSSKRDMPQHGVKDLNEGNLFNSDVEIVSKIRGDDSTPGYTSDESGTRSPTPPVASRRKLHSNIAFWEQLQRNAK